MTDPTLLSLVARLDKELMRQAAAWHGSHNPLENPFETCRAPECRRARKLHAEARLRGRPAQEERS